MLTGRDANQGECTHPCRWSYHLVEESRPGEYFPVMEDENGTFIFNSRDLCLLEHIPALVTSGVHSFKIEGRMKGINYVASVLRVYRQALDEYLANPDSWRCQPEWLDELAKLSHRGFTTGFLFGQPRNVGQEYQSAYIRSHDFVGVVDEVRDNGTLLISVRNRIKSGDLIEFIGPGMRSDTVTLQSFATLPERGAAVTAEVANPNSRILLTVPFAVQAGDLLRREKISLPNQ
jgi:putative protease